MSFTSPSVRLERAGLDFPNLWLKPVFGDLTELNPQEFLSLIETAGAVLDVSQNPGLIGGLCRQSSTLFYSASASDIERATSAGHAADLTQAHLIEVLSCLRRESLDAYALTIRATLSEFIIEGWLEAVESARQDGFVRSVGLSSEGHPVSTQLAWQFHDAFEFVIEKEQSDSPLRALAESRRAAYGNRVRYGDKTQAEFFHCDFSLSDVRNLASSLSI